MDLNVLIVDIDGKRDSNQVVNDKLARCKELGFQTICLSVIVDAQNVPFDVPPAPKRNELSIPFGLTVLFRLTVIVTDPMQVYKVNKCKERSKYDILAFQPQNYKILQHLSTGNTNFEILTFDLADRLDYNLFKISLQKLEQHGVCIEINYGQAQLSSSTRRNIISNGQSLTEKSTRNIILSSGVNDIFRLRGPKDAKYLGVLFLLSINKCHDAVFKNGLKAIDLAKHRSNPASSAIELKSAV